MRSRTKEESGLYPSRIYLSWVPYSCQSQTIAENLGAEPVYLGYLAGKKNVPKAILRYVLMTFHSIFLILWKRPKLVFVMNQPIFLPLTLFLLSKLIDVKYVVDSHSGLFNKLQWSWSLPIMKYVYRRSLFSITTNQDHSRLVESWGSQVEVLGAVIVPPEPVEPFKRSADPSLVVVGTFRQDEPIEEVIEASRRLPGVRFYVTGELKLAPRQLIKNAPNNVTFTDWLPRPQYVGLFKAMDGAISLVKKDNVMQMGAYEAMSWEVPIITSGWLVLRQNFSRGAIFVDNSVENIVQAVKELINRLDFYKAEITEMHKEYRVFWHKRVAEINSLIEKGI